VSQSTKENGTSLARSLLSLSTLAAQQRSLQFIICSLQAKLCRDAIVSLFSQQLDQAVDSQSSSESWKDFSPDRCWAFFEESTDQLNLSSLLKPKEISIMWELLKLSVANNSSEDLLKTMRNTLTSVLIGTSIFHLSYSYPLLLSVI